MSNKGHNATTPKELLVNAGKICLIEDCSKKAKCEGLCCTHFRLKYIDKFKTKYEKNAREKAKERYKKYREVNREKHKQELREYRKNNPEKVKIQIRNSTYKRVYGITIEIYEEMFKEQGGVCFICKRPPGKTRLCVDHRHVPKYKELSREDKRKEVRGLLCNYCNRTLGMIEHSNHFPRMRLNNIVLYFTKYKIKGD